MAMKIRHSNLRVAALLLSFAVCLAYADGRRMSSRHTSRQQDADIGERQSSIRRWIGRILPDQVLGSVQLGPGLSAQLETGLNLNLDTSGKWWLGDNVCVTSEEKEEAQPVIRSRDTQGDVSSDDDSDDDNSDDEDDGVWRHVTRVDSRWPSTRLRWRWSGGRRSNVGGTTHGAAFSHTCASVSSPKEQYRCTTVQRSGRTIRTTTTIYECCRGFKRAPASTDGCNIEIHPDLLNSLQSNGATEMSRVLNVTGFANGPRGGEGDDQIQYTVFAPLDSALRNYLPINQNADPGVVRVSHETYNEVVDQLNDIMADHMIAGRVLSADLTDDLMLRSALLPDSRRVRINRFHYAGRRRPSLITANCVPLVSVDKHMSNGVVHMVNNVIPSVVNTIETLVGNHPDLTIFKSLIKKMGLNSSNGSYTVFAPSDAAFTRLPSSLQQRLMNNNDQCTINLLRQHILPRIVCSSALKSVINAPPHHRHINLVNVDGRIINATVRHGEGNGSAENVFLHVDGLAVDEADLMATNGVVHIIDGVLFSKSAALGLLELAKSPSLNTERFVQLVERVGLQHNLESMSTSFTAFLPNNAAVEEMAGEIERMTATELRQLVDYHFVPGILTGNNLYDDRVLTTLNNGSKVLIKEYHSFPFSHRSRKTVQCVQITRSDINANSVCTLGVGHVISAILRHPATSILDILSRDSQFSRLIDLFQFSQLTYLLTHQGSPITLIAPNNTAFDVLPAATLTRLTSDVNTAGKVLRSLIIPDVLCCAGVFPPQLLQMPVHEVNLDGWTLLVDRNQETVTVDRVPIRTCDLPAVNGLVHIVDRFVPSVIARHVRVGFGSRAGGGSESRRSLLETIQDTFGL